MVLGGVALLVSAWIVTEPAVAQPVAAAPAVEEEPETSRYTAVVNRYCVTCHNERRATASLALDAVSLDEIADHAPLWEKVLQKLQTRSMPPPGRPRPDDVVYGDFVGWLETALDRAAASDPDPGRPTIHRLNRLEYTNAIRDLFGLEIDAQTLLPGDDLAFGFDNNADILTVAPGLLERYMAAARKISQLAIGDRAIDADVVRYPVSSLLEQSDRMHEELPFGSRGGTAVSHYFPLDGEYVIRLGLQGNVREPQEVDVRLDGARLGLLPVGRWPTDSETNALRDDIRSADDLVVRVPVQAGNHIVSVAFAQRNAVPEGVAPSRLPLWTFSTGRGYVAKMALESVQIEGPYQPDGIGSRGAARESAAPDRVFICRPDPGAHDDDAEACAREILSGLARRSFRRPLTAVDTDVLLDFYRAGQREGGFEAGIQRALEMMLVDPEFLFRIERDPVGVAPATAYQLSDLELASRLSFFLWGSIPDDALLEAATAGQLSERELFDAEVRRMLADPRANVLVSSFAAQWLHLRRMRSVTPDVNAFPAFDDNLRAALVRETELLLESQVRDDRSVVDLLDADYTFVNERLARHYGIEGVYGSRFRRVPLDEGPRRGLLGQGSILTVTSLATRTSPVVRGKWILENILGAPPPPPPPNVPELPEREEGVTPTSVRERLEAHRVNPVCASCHTQMDPLGFALENFDAVGKWRSAEGGVPIDAAGTLPDGTAFEGLPELQRILVDRKIEFVTTVTEKLLTYALGRGIEYYDRPAIRAIVREAAMDDYRWSSLILGITRSLPFQMRRSESS